MALRFLNNGYFAGSVGIGTQSPTQAKLVVNTTSLVASAFGRDGTDGDVVQIYNGLVGSTKIIALGASGNDGTIYSQFGNLLLQPSAGNVGIGTTSPQSKLQANGGDGLTVTANDTAYSQGYFGRIQSDYGTNPLRLVSRSGDVFRATAFGAAVSILTGPTSGTSEKLRITSAGGVSFGSTGTAYGTSGQILKSNGNASPTWVAASTVIGGPYLPLAGGTMTGNIVLDDNVELEVGADSDLRIYNNGTNNFILNTVGNLNIRQTADNGNITLQSDDGSGSYTAYLQINGLNEQTQVYKDFRFQDDVMAKFGSSSDLQIYHDGSNSYIKNSTGWLNMPTSGSGISMANSDFSKSIARFLVDAQVELYYNGTKRFETTSTGVAATGDINIDSALLSNQENTDVDAGTETVASVAIATYTAAFFDFVIKKTTNVRSGTVYACHDGTNVEFTETSTQDLGDTSDVTLSVDISGGNMRLQATTTSDNWSIKSLIRAI